MGIYPAYAPDQLLPAMRDFLIDQGLVRKPSVAGIEPPMWLDPRRGVPYPGQTEGLDSSGVETDNGLVLGAYPSTGIPSAPFEGFLVKLGAAIWYRGTKSPTVQSTHEQIRGVLHDRRNLNFNGLIINQSMMTREIQRIGSDERGFIYNCEFMFDMWASTYVY
jgi:hypothetical protein